MLVNDKDLNSRINSPMNLINKLKTPSKGSAMNLFGLNSQPAAVVVSNKSLFKNPFETSVPLTHAVTTPAVKEEVFAQQTEQNTDELNDLIDNSENQIKLSIAHNSALDLLASSLKRLSTEIDSISLNKLPTVISAASKTVNDIRRERNEAVRMGKDREVHYHFYTPEQRKIETYEVIEVAS